VAGLTDRDPAQVVRSVEEAMTYAPRTESSRMAGEAIGKGAAFAARYTTDPTLQAIGRASPTAENVVRSAVPAVAEAVETLVPVGKVAGAPLRAAREARRLTAERPKIPSTEELAKAAEQAYQRADAAGVVIAPHSVKRAVNSIREAATRENLNPKLHPKTAAAVEHLEQVAAEGKLVSLKEADQLRQVVKDAQTSIDRADRRMASIVLKRYDDYLQELGPRDTLAGDAPEAVAALKEARALYRRKSNAEVIDDIIRKAEIDSQGKYTQAGLEHAYRSEFKKLANNKRLIRTFSPEQRAAIEQVVKGGKITNALRNLGKFDPAKGGMGAKLGGITGGSLGAAIGGITGGVAGAGAGAGGGYLLGQAALGTVAHLAARGATRRTARNVERAREALVGRGLPPNRLSQLTRSWQIGEYVEPPGANVRRRRAPVEERP
jgi:hypothetical protein